MYKNFSLLSISFAIIWISFAGCTATSKINQPTTTTIEHSTNAANQTANSGVPDPTRFAKEINRINKIQFNDYKDRIVFTGSSSIRMWLGLPQYYPDHQIINTGFGGSQMSDLLHYLEEAVLQFSPSQVFIYEGDNDVAAKQSIVTIMDNTRKVIAGIHAKYPNCEIVLIAAKPSIARWQLKPAYDAINSKFKLYSANNDKISFANVWEVMLDEQGEVFKDIFIKDGLHMNKAGYDLWDKVIAPMVGANNGWEMLFNGKDFSNFEQLNGNAAYTIVDGQMVGTSKLKTPNSFMATKKKYGDFILEFEVLVDNGLNSGVQFRSLSTPDYNKGRVHGYQCEIETSPRKWAGGVYDEARRDWLYPLTRNEMGRHAFRTGEWNHYRIEAIGPHIRTWVNGIQCTNLVDDMTAEGFIAFQVHGIYNEAQEGKQVRWKNIKIKTTDLENSRKPVANYATEFSYLNNQLTDNEQRTGWRLLWDGTTTKGWRGAKSANFPTKGWTIDNGILNVLSSGGYESRNGGDIITEDLYSGFELSVDFKMTKGANSGIKYFVDPKLLKVDGSAIGLEFQILDDKKHADAAMGKNGNRTVGSLYDLIRAESTSSSRGKNFKGIGRWNNARIVVKGGKVEHWLNHVKVVEFDRFSQLFGALVEKSKYENWENFGRLPEGHILLQDHGDAVSFRNIKIREF